MIKIDRVQQSEVSDKNIANLRRVIQHLDDIPYDAAIGILMTALVSVTQN